MSIARAREASTLAKSKPRQALALADEALSNDPGHEASSLALWARGQAWHELGDNGQAEKALLDAIGHATDPLRSRIGVTLSVVESSLGRTVDAEARLAALADHHDGVIRGLAMSQLGLLKLYRGDGHSALLDLEQSLPLLENDPGELPAMARVRGNLGYCRIMLGQYEKAVEDLTTCLDEAIATNQDTVVASSFQNLGYARSRLGDLPAALADLEQARVWFQELGDPSRGLTGLFDDLAETYRLAGLTRDAVRYARLSTWVARRGDNLERLAEAEYRRAVCLLDFGQSTAAATAATQAANLFSRTGRSLWQQRAELVALEASTASATTELDDDMVEQVLATAQNLLSHGHSHEARALVNRVVQQLLDAGRQNRADEIASAQFPAMSVTERSATAMSMREETVREETMREETMSVPDRLEASYSAALTAAAKGTSLASALSGARSLVEEHAVALGDQELRSGTVRLTERFRSLAVGEALNNGQAGALLEAEEMWRAISLDLPKVVVPDDEETAHLLIELRKMTLPTNEATTADPASGSAIGPALDPDDTQSNRAAARADLEERLRRRSMMLRRSRGDALTDDVPTLAGVVEHLTAAVGPAVFVEWLEDRGQLVGVEVTGRGAQRLWPAGSMATAIRLTQYAHRSIARINATDDQAEIGAAFADLMADCAALRTQLWPNNSVDPERPMILSPPPMLMSLPWRLIVGGVGGGADVRLTPSASSWCSPSQTAASPWRPLTGSVANTPTAVVVGPGLLAEAADAAMFTAALPASTVLVGMAATADAFKKALSASEWIHVSCHGWFRPDNPRFSSLDLADGPFTLFEVDALAHVPDVVVLAACDSGKVAPVGGGELMGTAPAFLAAGASIVVAPISPVRDVETCEVMAFFYQAVDEGPALAAKAMDRAVADGPPELITTAAAFQVLESGRRSPLRASPVDEKDHG